MSSPSSPAASLPPHPPHHSRSPSSFRSYSNQSIDSSSSPISNRHSHSSVTHSGLAPESSGYSSTGSVIYVGSPDPIASERLTQQPPPPFVRISSGIASALVGLGSPKLNFGRDWAGGRWNGSTEAEHVVEVEGEEHSAEDEVLDALVAAAEQRQREKGDMLGLEGRGIGRQSSEHEDEPGLSRALSQVRCAMTATSAAQLIVLQSLLFTGGASTDRFEDPSSPRHRSQSPCRLPSPSVRRRRPSSSSSTSARLQASPQPRNRPRDEGTSPRPTSSSNVPRSPRPMPHRAASSTSCTSATSVASPVRTAEVPRSRLSPTKSQSSSSSYGRPSTAGNGLTIRERAYNRPPADSAIFHGTEANRMDQELRRRRSVAKRMEQSLSGSISLQDSPPNVQPAAHRAKKRSSGSLRDTSTSEPGDETVTAAPQDDLDERIREAEAQIQKTHSRRSRIAADVLHGSTNTMRKLDTRSKSTESPEVDTGSTLRRSATVSSVSAKTPNGDARGHLVEVVNGDRDERDRSGSNGGFLRRKPLPADFRSNGLVSLTGAEVTILTSEQFTPSPKPSGGDTYKTSGELPSRSGGSRIHLNPSDKNDPSPFPSRYSTASRNDRLPDKDPSPSISRTFSRSSRFDGLERSSSVTNNRTYSKRHSPASVAGLPRARDDLDDRGLPSPRRMSQIERQRPESVLDTIADRYRYSFRAENEGSSRIFRDGDRGLYSLMSERKPRAQSSRLNLTPADSVSAIGAPSEGIETGRKDPLEVLRRIEAQRNVHNQQWEADRAAAVLGDREVPRLGSQFDHTPRNIRPVTSMSSLRQHVIAPRTAPHERHRRLFDDAADSPSLNRVSSRTSDVLHLSTEPRSVRSSTSLGPSASASLASNTASTEHGRLLFEAFQSLETKLPNEAGAITPSFLSATRSSESINGLLQSTRPLVAQISVDLEVDPDKVQEQLAKLTLVLGEAHKASDQNIRDLTRIMLDLPKLFRDGNIHRSVNDLPKRWRPSSPSAYESPLRRNGEVVRPATSMGDYYSPSKRSSRDATPPTMAMGRDRSSVIPPSLSKVRSNGSNPDEEASTPIEASGPTVFSVSQPAVPVPHSAPQPRNVLKKKASTNSTNTVRGSTFLPSASKVRTTTAISAITAGDLSPTRARSLRSQKSSLEWDVHADPSSPMSRYSFYTAEERVSNPGSVVEANAVSLLAHAARKREELGRGQEGLAKRAPDGDGGEVMRRPSVSERFKATLRRTTGKEGK